MKRFAAGLLLLTLFIPEHVAADGCPEGYSDCGGSLCCPTVQQ